MIQKIRNYIKKQTLLKSIHSKIIVGLSGGADSIALLHILHQLDYECVAAHCNFHLRREESYRDEKAARDFAAFLQIPFFKQDLDTENIAREKKISVEMAARDFRYEWFEQLRKEQEAEAIAVAHHQDDNIETMLLNLIRGTGIRGLTGMKPKNGHIIRPFLEISKKEITHYVEKERLPYIIDSTNEQDKYTRNKIRLRIIPLLKSVNPSADTALLRTMKNLNEVAGIYNASIQVMKEKIFDSETRTINITILQETPSPESVLFEILKDFDFKRDVVHDIFHAINSPPGKIFYSQKYTLTKERNTFLLINREPVKDENTKYTLNEEDKEIKMPLPIRAVFEKANNNITVIKDKKIAYLDADQLQFPLEIRKWKAGDKFIPSGMKNFQKLSDFFNNNKFNSLEKKETWLLCSNNDIVWIVGHRIDERYRMKEITKKTYILKLF